MTDVEIRDQLSDLKALALTAWAEARGDAGDGSSVEERIAVMSVIRNRLRVIHAWGDTYRDVCFARYQFSCWNDDGSANHRRLMEIAYRLVTKQPTMDLLLEETLYLADGVMRGIILDRTNGAAMYYAPEAMVPKGSVPKWAQGRTPTAHVGRQVFYRYA